ncbi:transmembrane prolyl 4-hydroxylase [Sinocyclocheilus rhinocerous]|uniref:Transmembrane prolyl 4-hydroxylase-like n=1 Tax=Sinocyclocheilus rhinocerous TaxID=307959 RepID=A0A673KBD8_9TELE|nr:PREDICTED: transmembrane prolyl 4-hydroxylase-like [Sinocyclocheilus rhinocerous]
MGEYEDRLHELEGEANYFPPPPRHPGGRERLHIQKSSVCSRAYFVVVMAFFHIYIINIIALLLYVHYNTGSGEQDIPLENSASAPRPMPTEHRTPSSANLSPELSFQLPRLEGIRVGHVQRVSLVPDRTHNMRTLSLKPLLFEIPGFLSVEESSVVMQLAQLKGLTHSSLLTAPDSQEEQLTEDQLFSLLDLNQDGLLQREEILSLSHSTDGSWLSSYNLRKIHTGLETNPSGKVTRLTRLPSSLVDLSEPMEVVRYEQGGYSHAHHDSGPTNHDSSCAHTHLAANNSASKQVACRYLTALLHLNSADGGGETSFPVADNRTYEEEVLGDLSQQYCDKGNLKVKPVAGTALLWYNHLSDGNGWVGELDEFSLHGDCLVTRGFKWTGSVWVNIDPDQQRQERYQRLVSWHPDGQSKKPEHGDLHQDL